MADQSLEKGSFAAVLPWVGLKPSAKGEGTRGGHVIGHTRSGKPIYAAGYRTHQDLTQPETHDAADIHEQAAAKLRREISKYKNRSGIPVNAFAEEAAHHHDPKVRELVAQHTKEMAAAQSYRSGARAMTRPGALLQSENPMRGMDDLVSEYLEKAEASGNSPFGRNTNPEEEEAKKPGESLKPELPEQGVSPNKQAMPNQKPGKEGAPGGESLAGKLPAPSIHEDRASLEAALSKVSHLGEKGFRSLHPDTQQELISDGYLDPQGNLTAAGHKELVDYFAKHAANPNLGPQAQQKAQMRHQAHTEAAGQEASGHPAVHATWQQKQIEMRSGGMAQPQQGQGTPQQAPGMAPSRPPMPQGAPQMGGQASRPMPPQGSIPGQPGPLGMAPRSPMGAPSGASVGARPPMPPAEGARTGYQQDSG